MSSLILLIDGMTAVHDWSFGAYAAKYADRLAELRAALPPVEHPVVIEHPVTGERVWFNQAEQFHPTSLPAEVASFLLDEYRGREHELPQWASFADGAPIASDTLAEIRTALCDETALTSWQAGDLLVIDNVLALHGRTPFTGPRRVLIAMD